ncbi:hypothetical protein NFI96_006461 [Prochilodus magdalenae]|nr:hypothetical protein NFI96_006461 [Prochilodus magdalenae]
MIVDFRRVRHAHLPLNVGGSAVELVFSYRYLGVHLSNNLTWSNNTSSLVRKAHQRLYFLWRLRRVGLGSSVLTSFYRCVVESVLCSSINVWHGSCSAADRKALQRLVKAAQSPASEALWEVESGIPGSVTSPTSPRKGVQGRRGTRTSMAMTTHSTTQIRKDTPGPAAAWDGNPHSGDKRTGPERTVWDDHVGDPPTGPEIAVLDDHASYRQTGSKMEPQDGLWAWEQDGKGDSEAHASLAMLRNLLHVKSRNPQDDAGFTNVKQHCSLQLFDT